MFKGFYSAASAMTAEQRRVNMLTNNMANASTPGYKADQSSMRSFPEMLLKRFDAKTDSGPNASYNSLIGRMSTGVYMQETTPLFRQGDMNSTDNSTDIALLDANMPIDNNTNLPGTVFFAVETADGQAYTRNGNFTLDGQGYLTTPSGQYVLDQGNNRILLQSENFVVSPEGYISENGQNVARLGVKYATNPYQMMKQGDGLYKTADNAELPDAYAQANVQFALQQGYIENSNVDSSRTYTDMLTAYRSFEANQKVLQAYDRSMDKVANEVGKL